MARRFSVARSYRREHDVRGWTGIVERLRESEPEGVCWAIIGQRRSGKTWGLRALAERLGAAARYVDLQQRRNRDLSALKADAATWLLVDEPGRLLFVPGDVGPGRPRVRREDGARGLLEAAEALRGAGKRLVVAMTPAEWSALRDAGLGDGLIHDKDLCPALEALTRAESLRIAGDDRAACALLDALEGERARWRRSPFLTTLLLEIAEARGLVGDPVGARDDLEAAAIAELLATTIAAANAEHRYTAMVLYEGLDGRQQAILRKIARESEEVGGDELGPLLAGGLVDRLSQRTGWKISDPVIAAHLPPPLRIHHVSDVHVGARAASRVYAGGSPVSDHLADAAGRGPIRESYREHLSQRAGQGSAPQILVVSGDLVETGAETEFAAARAWIDSLRPSLAEHPDLRADEPRVLVVGGNHDVDWTQTRGPAGARARHLPFARAFADLPRPRLEEPPEARALTAVRYPDAGVVFVLLGSAEFSGQLDDDLIEILDRARDRAIESDARGEAEEAQRLRERLGRIDPGLVHQRDLGRLRGARWPEAVRIAVLHHPLSPLPASVDVAPYAGLVNAGAVTDALIDRAFTLVLHGHLHSQWWGEERWPSHQRGAHVLRIVAAPSLGSREVHEHHGYNEILIHREGDDHFEVAIVRYQRQGDTWRRVDDPRPFRPGAAEEGT